MATDAETAGGTVEYFMIRIHPAGRSGDAPLVAGAIERLGTGEKLTFESGDELLRLLGSWPDPGCKMQAGQDFGNPSGLV